MSQNPFRVYFCFNEGDERVGQLPSSSTLHQLVSAISRQVFAALRTRRIFDALKSIAEQWSAYHFPKMDPGKAVQDFQRLIHDAEQNHSLWANMILHWNRPQINGIFYREDPLTGQPPMEFNLSQQWFGFNAKVSVL